MTLPTLLAMKRTHQPMWGLAVLSAAVWSCGQPAMPSQAAPPVAANAPGRSALVSAFFGLDNSLPQHANRLCFGAAGRDGLPVVLSHTIDPRTLQREDFRVVTRSGVETTPSCVTLAPAVGAGELRTVLLIGELGSAVDQPAVVRIVGDILSDGSTGGLVNLRGAAASVIPLELGPMLVLAEDAPGADRSNRRANRGTECPEDTVQVVRATWAGGIRLRTGDEVGEAERALYRVTVQGPDGSRVDVEPFALADLDDNDNNHSLCLNVAGTALSVACPAGHVVDPNGDVNGDTRVDVTR